MRRLVDYSCSQFVALGPANIRGGYPCPSKGDLELTDRPLVGCLKS